MKTPEELKVFHEQRQAGVAVDELCIREGIVLKPHADSFYPFEFFCWRSPEMAVELNCFIEYAKGRKSLLDIGALHGIFALVFAEMNKEGQAYAFEPAPNAFEILKHNTSGYDNIKVFKRAISEGYGVLDMHMEWDHYVVGGDGNGLLAKCFSGDTFCSDYGLIDTLKIDVEGHELKVLRGLTKTIAKYHPVIFLELHPQRVVNEGDTVKEVIDFLQEWDYRAIDSRTNEPISFEEIEAEKIIDLRLILL